MNSQNPNRREKAVELIRTNILTKFYLIGVLEDFDKMLTLFEKTLPEYFSGASEIWNSGKIQAKRESTRTRNRTEMSEKAKKIITQVKCNKTHKKK